MSAPEPKVKAKASFGDLRARVLSAIVMIALALGALAAGGVWFILFWLAAALAIVWEWQTLVGQGARERVLIGGAGVAIAAALAAQHAADLALVPLFAAAALVAWRAAPGQKAWAAGGVFYAGALIVAVAAIRPPFAALEPPFNLRAILWLFAVVWGTDIGAYFGGRLIGGRKLWPRVSAGKTWSGAIVGALVGAGLGAVVALWKPLAATPLAPILMVGFAASVASQLGDLFESAVKRHFDVKDSSHLIPGHGGVMDRLDGFVTAAIFVALLGVARGAHSAAEGLLVWR